MPELNKKDEISIDKGVIIGFRLICLISMILIIIIFTYNFFPFWEYLEYYFRELPLISSIIGGMMVLLVTVIWNFFFKSPLLLFKSYLGINKTKASETIILSSLNRLDIWGGFEEYFYGYNDPWGINLTESDMLEHMEKRYKNNIKGKYIIFFDEKNEEESLERIRRCKQIMEMLSKTAKDKIELYQINAPLPKYSFWVGKKHNTDFSIIYLSEEPFMKNDIPIYTIYSRHEPLSNSLKAKFNEVLKSKKIVMPDKLGEF